MQYNPRIGNLTSSSNHLYKTDFLVMFVVRNKVILNQTKTECHLEPVGFSKSRRISIENWRYHSWTWYEIWRYRGNTWTNHYHGYSTYCQEVINLIHTKVYFQYVRCWLILKAYSKMCTCALIHPIFGYYDTTINGRHSVSRNVELHSVIKFMQHDYCFVELEKKFFFFILRPSIPLLC